MTITRKQAITVRTSLNDALCVLRNYKPDDKSGMDRRFAITITEMEKVLAYFETWVVQELEDE